MSFDRWLNTEGRTAAYRQFKKDHTRLNKIYWHSVSEKSFFDYQYRQAKKTTGITPFSILKITKPTKGSNNIENDLDVWHVNRNAMANWVRLNCLLSLYSYYELYLNRVTRTAQESDPGLFFGAAKSIDGIKILKANNWKDAYLPNYSAEVTKGTWSQRISAIEKTFDIQLEKTRSQIISLEKSRKTRNAIAHYFGRDLSEDHILEYETSSDINLSERSMIKYLDLFEQIVCEIDSKLLKYIGEYEIIRYYHQSIEQIKSDKREFKKLVNQSLLWENKSIEYCKELIEYYEKCET